MNYKLFKALVEFLKAMRPFVVSVIQNHYPNDNWEDIYYEKLSPEKQETWNRAISAGTSAQERIDYNNLKVFVLAFKTELIQDLGRADANTLISNLIELCNLRNQCNHFQTIEYDDVEYAFSIMKKVARLLDWSDLHSKLANIWNNFDEANPPQPNIEQELEEESASETDNDPEGNLDLPEKDADAQDEIIRSIIQVLVQKNLKKKLYIGLTIYVSNQRLISLVKTNDFKERLCAELNDYDFDALSKNIRITTDKAPDDASQVMTGLVLVLKQKSESKANENEETEQTSSTTSTLELPDNAIEAREKIIKEIIKKLNSLYKIKEKFKGITIYVSNPLLILHIDNDEFKDDLRLELENTGLNSLFDSENHPIVISTDTPPINAIVVPDLGLAIVLTKRASKENGGDGGKPQPTGKIKISIYEGQGSLKETEYVLDSTQKRVFHIGWSRTVRAKGPLRINDVVIKDDETDDELKKLNSKVSRSHADIAWRDGRFFLKAMPSGCRPEGGAVTKVFRDDKEIELLTSSMFEQLCDGDLIELGKAVILQVNIVE